IDAAIQSNLRETTTRVLASLTPREERVLRMRFGIGMNTDHTLEEVGQQFSVTREPIREIEAKALRKLKHTSRSRKLRSFLDNAKPPNTYSNRGSSRPPFLFCLVAHCVALPTAQCRICGVPSPQLNLSACNKAPKRSRIRPRQAALRGFS